MSGVCHQTGRVQRRHRGIHVVAEQVGHIDRLWGVDEMVSRARAPIGSVTSKPALVSRCCAAAAGRPVTSGTSTLKSCAGVSASASGVNRTKASAGHVPPSTRARVRGGVIGTWALWKPIHMAAAISGV
jgi:hypothetical protein